MRGRLKQGVAQPIAYLGKISCPYGDDASRIFRIAILIAAILGEPSPKPEANKPLYEPHSRFLGKRNIPNKRTEAVFAQMTGIPDGWAHEIPAYLSLVLGISGGSSQHPRPPFFYL